MQNADMADPLCRNQEDRSISPPSNLLVACYKGPYFTPNHRQKMFGLSLKFTKKTVEAGAKPQTPTGPESLRRTPGPPSRIEPLGASTQGRSKARPATQNASQKSSRGDKISKLGRQSLKLVS